MPPPMKQEEPIESLYSLRLRSIWNQFRNEHFSFWMICAYLIFEYVRPHSIIPALDILPWAQLFICLSLIGRALDKKAKWVSDPANIWITLFLLTIVAASFNATYPAISWSHFNDFFNWYVIYFLIINIVNTERRFLIFLAIFLLASFKLSWFGAKTWTMRGFGYTSWGIQGPPGFFQNSGELSIQMLMFSPIAYHLAQFLRPFISKVKFYVLLLLPITGAMTVMGASSRGSQIGLGYQAYRCLLKGRLSIKKIVAVVAVVYAALSLLPEQQKDRFTTAGTDRTSQQRLLYWRHGIEMIKAHPALGIGYFNFPRYYEEHHSEDLIFPHAQLPHNIFVQVGTDAGFIGLFVMAMLLYQNGKVARDVRKLSAGSEDKPFNALATGIVISMWGFVIAGQFVTVTYYPFFWINLAFAVALRNIARNHYTHAKDRVSGVAPSSRRTASPAPITTSARAL